MQKGIAALSRLNAMLCRISLWLAGAGLAVMTVIVFAQVFMRYVVGDSLLWVEPTAILLMSWFIFLGAAVGVHENFHMGFEVLLYFLPDRFGRLMQALSNLSVLVFAICMVVYGWQLMVKTWGSSVPIIKLPGGFTYMPLFAGGVLMTLFSIEHVLRVLTGSRTPDAAPDAEDILMSEA